MTRTAIAKRPYGSSLTGESWTVHPNPPLPSCPRPPALHDTHDAEAYWDEEVERLVVPVTLTLHLDAEELEWLIQDMAAQPNPDGYTPFAYLSELLSDKLRQSNQKMRDPEWLNGRIDTAEVPV